MVRPMLVVAVVAMLSAGALAQPPNGPNPGAAAPPQGANLNQPPGGAGGPAPNAMFAVIDVDGDGIITSRELRKAVKALKSLDLNKDGKITLEETMPQPSGPAAGAGAAGSGFRGGQAGGANGFGAGAGDPRSGPNLSQFDRNGDGALSPDEVPPNMMGLVRGSDQNNDGRLDPAELQAIQQRMNERARGQRSLPPGVSVGPQGVNRTSQ